MSERDQDRWSPAKKLFWAAIIGILATAVVMGGISYGLNQQAFYAIEAKRRIAYEATGNARRINQSCALIIASRQSECIAKARIEYDAEVQRRRHDADDLVAQQTSALWASITGVAALVGMAISILGVFLVWTTFREQRRANELAHAEAERAKEEAAENGRIAQAALAAADTNARAATLMAREISAANKIASATLDHSKAVAAEQAERLAEQIQVAQRNAEASVAMQRPWIDFSLQVKGPSWIRGDKVWVRFEVVANNHGRNPALHVRIAQSYKVYDPETPNNYIEELTEQARVGYSNIPAIFPGEEMGIFGFSGPFWDRHNPIIYICVAYRTGVFEEDRFTCFSYTFNFIDDTPSAISVEDFIKGGFTKVTPTKMGQSFIS